MIGMAVVLLIGTFVSIAWAPETKSIALNEASDPHTGKNQQEVGNTAKEVGL